MTDEDNTDPRQQKIPGLSRRKVIAGAASIAAVSGLTRSSSATPLAATHPTEGYFLVFETPGTGDTRVFFISSEWLSFFELTEAYRQNQMDPADVVDNIRASGSPKIHKIKALYADISDDAIEPFPGATFIPAVPPADNFTYLAMSIAPDRIPA